MDTRPDGTLTIDFDLDDGTTQTVTVRPPKVGGYRRLRKELYEIDTKQAAHDAELNGSLSEQAKRNLAVEFHENALLDWWTLILCGDPTFAALADTPPAVGRDSWPLELATN